MKNIFTCLITSFSILTITSQASFALEPIDQITVLPIGHTLTIDAQGGRVVSEPNGIDCDNSICSYNFLSETFVALAAVAEQSFDQVANHLSWSGDCSGSNEACLINMTGAKSVTANFGALGRPLALFTLTVNVSGIGPNVIVVSNPEGINCSAENASCSAQFSNLQSVALSATQEDTTNGFTSNFLNWTGACNSNNTACLVNMAEGDKSVNANYAVLAEPAFAVSYPVGANKFYQHPRVAPSVLSVDAIKPFGLGENGSSFRVQLPPMQGPVDIYLGFTMENNNNVYLINSTNGINVLADNGLIAWKSDHNGDAIDETVFSAIPWDLLPEGVYNFYVMITPVGSTIDYYLLQSYRNNDSTINNPFLD